MANIFLDARQSQMRTLLDQVNSTAVAPLDSTMVSVNSELTAPARLIAASTPSLVVTVGSGTVVNPNTGKNRVISFIGNLPVSFSGGTITFPSTSGNITTSPGTTYPITIGVSQYVAVLVQLNGSGDIVLVVGAAASSLGAVVIPSGNASLLSLGYIIVESNGSSVIQNVTDAMIYQFASSGGGGGNSTISFAFTNNQSSPANITGFDFSYPTTEGFKADYLISRRYSGSSVVLSEDSAFYGNLGSSFNNSVFTAIEQANAQILVGGQFTSLNSNTRDYLVRLNSDGTEDTSFYTNLGTGLSSYVLTLAEQSNTQVVVGGEFTSLNGNSRGYIVRLNSDGTEDSTFATNTGSGANSFVRTVAVQANAQILLGGEFNDFNGVTQSALTRINSDGTQDSTFATNIGSAFTGPIYSVIEQADTKILAGGSYTNFNGNTRNYLVRINSDGTEDSSFYTNLGTAFNTAVNVIAEQSNTQILVGGQFTTFNGSTRNYLVRLNSDGTEDTSFYTNLGTGFNAQLHAITEQSNGQILIGGEFTSFNGNTRNRLVRLNSDGTEDTTFATFLGSGFGSIVHSTFEQLDNNILVGGEFTVFDGNARDYLIRIINNSSSPNTELITVGSFRGAYLPSLSMWVIGAQDSFQPEGDPGIEFSITSGGQVQYTSTNIAGTAVEDSITFTTILL